MIQLFLFRGVKLWIRCDGKSGYCHQLAIYLGKEETKTTKHGLYFDVVNDLTKSLRGHHFQIFTDNLYSSIPLAKFLYSKKTYFCGTLRTNKKFIPNAVRDPGKNMLRGEMKTFQSTSLSNLTCTVWKDTKEVRFVSTMSNPTLLTHAVRRVKGQHVQVNMPHCASQYTKSYGGVDR